MNYFKKIMGNRIYLSPRGSSEEEVNSYTKWLNDPEVTDYIGSTSKLTNLEGERSYLEKPLENKCFSILTLDNKLIGTISLEEINNIDRSAELGIFIGEKDYLNNGYGREAINLLLDYGFNYLNLHRIYLELLEANKRAYNCYLKCGFKDTGRDREAMYLNGRYYDVINMDILKDEFKEDYIRNKCVK